MKKTDAPNLTNLQFISDKQAAEYLGVDPKTLRDWRWKGYVSKKNDVITLYPPKCYKRGGSVYYLLADLNAWILEGMVEAAQK